MFSSLISLHSIPVNAIFQEYPDTEMIQIWHKHSLRLEDKLLTFLGVRGQITLGGASSDMVLMST